MKISTISLYFAFAGLLGGCSKWPPFEEDLKERFFTKRTDVELLAKEMRQSNYFDVFLSPGGDVYSRGFSGEKWGDSAMLEGEPENPTEWKLMFERAGLDSVAEQENGDVYFHLDLYFGGQDVSSSIAFVSSLDLRKTYKECVPEYAKVECGQCIVGIEDGWWIRYSWFPSEISPELDEAYFSDEISEEEYWEQIARLDDACIADGGTRIDSLVE